MVSDEKYQYLFHSLACGICWVALDDDFTLLYANPFYYSIYGYTPESAELRGFKNVRYILPEATFQSVHDTVMEHVHNDDRLFDLEFQGVHSSGDSLWLLVRCTYDPANPEAIICVLMDIAEHKQLEDELRMSMTESQLAFQLTDKLMYIFDIAEKCLYLPRQVSEEFGLPQIIYNAPESIVANGIIDDSSVTEFLRFYNSMIQGIPDGQSTVKKRRKDGTYGWYFAKYALIYDNEGVPKRSVISGEDITEQRTKELTYLKWSQYFKSQEGKTIGYYEYDLTTDRKIEDVGDNPPDYIRPLKGYTETLLYIAENFVYEEDRDRFYWFFDRNRLLTHFYDHRKEASIEYRRSGPNGFYWVRATIQLIADPYTDHVKMFLMTLDIDKEKKKELKLRRLVETDEMTGLLTRETFVTKISEIMSMNEFVLRHALIILDIDQFKQHNDLYGHQFGDRVIRDTAAILKKTLRKNDLCGRLGGDEFMLFLNDVSSKKDMLPRIESICQMLNRDYPGKGTVSCSLGVAFYPNDGISFQELYKNADAALYKAKEAGRSTYYIFRT